jgi:hypothetical protein
MVHLDDWHLIRDLLGMNGLKEGVAGAVEEDSSG